jgi:drug/metabolite transporter (DMT)-like permease
MPMNVFEGKETRSVDQQPMRTKGYFDDLLLLSVVTIWGLNFAIIKSAYIDFHPIAFNAVRFVISSLTMFLFLQIRGGTLRVDRKDLPEILALALVVNTLYQFFFIIGLASTKAGNAGLLLALVPICAYLVGIARRHERFSRTVLAGILVSLGGVAAIMFSNSSGAAFGDTWKGDLLMIAAAFCWGWYSGSSSSLLAKYGAVRLTVILMIVGTAALVPVSLPWLLRQNWAAVSARSWGQLMYASLLAIVYSYFVWARALVRIGVARTAIFSNITPVVALLGGWLVLGEVPSAAQIVGVVCVLAGVFIVGHSRGAEGFC